jgi:hypothetical protein
MEQENLTDEIEVEVKKKVEVQKNNFHDILFQ